MSKKLNLYVATAFDKSGKKAVAGWIRKNGNPDRLPSGTKRLKNVGSKQAETVARILSINAALRDVPKNSTLLVHLDNLEIATALNNGDIRALLKRAYQTKAKHFSEAAHGLLDEIARHEKVEAEYVPPKSNHHHAASMIVQAHTLASDVKCNVDEHQKKRRKGRRGPENRAAIAASVDAEP